MEKGLNSYYGMGYNYYLYAKNSINVAKEIGNYNGLASMASQSAEKLLKAIIEVYFVDDEDRISSELLLLILIKCMKTTIVTLFFLPYNIWNSKSRSKN